jgi:thiopurine S-methyltransferase
MDANFWQQKWESNDIAFHERVANPFLVTYFKKLALRQGSRVFVPLCGKTLDIAWLLSQGYRVAGAELSALAIAQLFQELGVEPVITSVGELARYSASNIDIFVGDIFALSGAQLGTVDVIYDRAALVALPPEMRKRYTAHLMEITARASQLLITFEYDQRLMEGPPFSLTTDEIKRHYGKSFAVTLVNSKDVAGGLKGKCVAQENIWLLRHA